MDADQIRETICSDINMLSSKVVELLGSGEDAILAAGSLRAAAHILSSGSAASRPYPPLRSAAIGMPANPSAFAPTFPAPGLPGVNLPSVVNPGVPPPPMTPAEMQQEAHRQRQEMERRIALKLHESGVLPPGSVQEQIARRVIGGHPEANGEPEEASGDLPDDVDAEPVRERPRRRRKHRHSIPSVSPDSRCPGCNDYVGEHPVASSYGQDDKGRSVLVLCGDRLVRSYPSERGNEVTG